LNDIQAVNELGAQESYRESFNIPNTYILGSDVEIDVAAFDADMVPLIVNSITIDVQVPDGTIDTLTDVFTGSGYFYAIYRPEIRGWYTYMVSITDTLGLVTISDPDLIQGFEVKNSLF